jgi:hypothetical protein
MVRRYSGDWYFFCKGKVCEAVLAILNVRMQPSLLTYGGISSTYHADFLNMKFMRLNFSIWRSLPSSSETDRGPRG